MWTQIAFFSVVLASVAPATSVCLPPVGEVVDRALEVAGLLDGPSASRRARLAPLLPNSVRVELRAAEDDLLRDSYDVDQDFDEMLAADGIDLSDSRQMGVDHVREARVVFYWQLDSLVWSNETLSALRYEEARERAAWELTEEVVGSYFDLVAASREPPDSRPRTALVPQRTRALLDERTDGWFSAASECSNSRVNPP